MLNTMTPTNVYHLSFVDFVDSKTCNVIQLWLAVQGKKWMLTVEIFHYHLTLTFMTQGLLLLNFDHELDFTYRQTSSISRTKSENLNVFVSSLPDHWSQVLSREWRCSWSSADRLSNSIWVINNFNAYWSATYIRGLTVVSLIIISINP